MAQPTLVVVIRDGLLMDFLSDQDTDLTLIVVDYDAREFGEEGDDRIHKIDDEDAWVTGYLAVINPEFVQEVVDAWG